MTELDDWPILLTLFPPEWQQLARRSGAVRRLRGFPSVEALLRTLLLHVGCGWSLRETAVQAKLAGIAEVSDVTLLNRLRDAEDWLRQLCQQLWTANGVQLAAGFQGRTMRLLDATVVREPGKTGSQWRIHYSLRLPHMECDQFDLTSTRGTDAAERFQRFQFHAGELVLADAGYCNPAGIASVVVAQADLCLRLNPHALPLFDTQDRPFRLLKQLARLRTAGDRAEWPVWVHAGKERIAGRVCAIRKSREAIERAQRRLTLKQQSGKSVGPATRKFAEYVLVFTTLSASEASVDQVLETYRLRWQVELTFKRLKSIAQIGHLPKHDEQSSRAWLYGKLLVALLCQQLAATGRNISPWGYQLAQASSSQSVA
jgi:Transposase DDE domain